MTQGRPCSRSSLDEDLDWRDLLRRWRVQGRCHFPSVDIDSSDLASCSPLPQQIANALQFSDCFWRAGGQGRVEAGMKSDGHAGAVAGAGATEGEQGCRCHRHRHRLSLNLWQSPRRAARLALSRTNTRSSCGYVSTKTHVGRWVPR